MVPLIMCASAIYYSIFKVEIRKFTSTKHAELFVADKPTFVTFIVQYTVKPVYNDHLMGYFSAFWTSSRWPRAT